MARTWQAHEHGRAHYFTATHSTSTSAFLGSVFTAMAERAGNGALKNWAYTSFMAAKLPMSLRNTVVFTTLSSPEPAASRMALALSSDWRVCSQMPPSGNIPVAGSMGSWPDAYTKPLASMA